MRRLGVLCVCLLLASCAGSGGPEPAATPAPTPPSTAATTVPTPDAPTTTTAAPAASAQPPPILVSNAEGAFQILGDGAVTQLVVGPVAYAVDDTRGGLLFQVQRGRKILGGYDGEVPPEDVTIIWWIPAGSSAPRELLVPTPETGHYLSLHDAMAVGDSFAVVYERHEATTPFDGDTVNSLRLYDVATGTVTELTSVRGHEWNLGDVSAGAGVIAATEVQTLGSGCWLLGATGKLVTRPGFPSADAACFDVTTHCPDACALAADAGRCASGWIHRVGNGVEWEIAVADMTSGFEVARFTVPVAGRWGPADLDVASDYVLMNRAWEAIYDQPALLADLAEPEAATEIPVAGRARFATAPVAIAPRVGSPGLAEGGAAYYRAGDDGVFHVVGGVETRLVDEPVWSAFDDNLGGVIYTTPSGGAWWLRRGTTAPRPFTDLEPGTEQLEWITPHFTGVLADRPVVFYEWWRSPEGRAAEDAVMTCDETQLISRDLLTGAIAAHMCLPVEDAGYGVRSVGAGTLVGAPFGSCGGTSSSYSIHFWDVSGHRLDVAANPFPPSESCAPCELEAMISPDGRLLAYEHRPDSFHHESPYYTGPACGGGDEQRDAWWEGSRHVPAEVVVMEIATGDVQWRIEAPTGTYLRDFDGRYLVLSNEAASLIYDTHGEHATVEVDGRVALERPALMLGPEDATLRDNGIGLALFGDPAHEAMLLATALLGPPATDDLMDPAAEDVALPHGFGADHYFRLATWPQHGLTLVFSDGNYFRSDGTPHFIGWNVDRTGLATGAGITVGSPVDALGSAYPGTLTLPERYVEECEEGWMFRIEPHPGTDVSYWHRITGQLDGDPDDAGTHILTLTGGAAPTC